MPCVKVRIDLVNAGVSILSKSGDEIESIHRHDFKFCKCGAVVVGGLDYLRRCGDLKGFTELSEYEE